MPNRPQSIPSPEWQESAGFRETLLFYFTPPQAAALRTLSDILHEHCMECGEWHRRPGPMLWYEVKAAETDIRHVAGFLVRIGIDGGSELSRKEYKLAVAATKVAEKLVQLAELLRRRLDATGYAGPDEPPPPPFTPPAALLAAMGLS